MDVRTPSSLFIVGHQHLVAEGILLALGTHPDIETLGVASSGAEAISALAESPADVIVIDQHLPDCLGIELAARMVAALPNAKVILLASTTDPSVLDAALGAGCRGFVAKGARFEDLVSTIRRVADGEVAIPGPILQDLARRVTRRRDRSATGLTNREREVLAWLARGASTDDISTALEMSVHTVRSHVRSILHKLNAHSRLQAVSTARTLQLIEPL